MTPRHPRILGYFISRLFFLLLFFFAVNAYPQAGDCPPNQICASQNQTCGASTVNELNAGTRGCLLSNEATASYWYRLCVTTNGTIRFTINPGGGANDYDFAVWGPNSACPPTAGPIRCSYALVSGGSDNTGVNSTNNAPQTDNSEGVVGGNQWVQDISATAGQCYLVCVNNYGSGSNNFAFTLGGTATYTCLMVPIELLSFNCEPTQAGITISWTTASETNNDYFTVERSPDGATWENIATVDGAGHSTEVLNYSFTDDDPRNGINYYRLTQTDLDGKSETFYIIACEYEAKPYVMNIYSITGQLISSSIVTDYRKTFAAAQLPSGIYLVEMIKGDSPVYLKLSK